MSIFPTRILLATDGSGDADLALATAVDPANTTDSELHVITAAPGYPSYDVDTPVVAENLRQQAGEILEDQAKKIQDAGGRGAGKHPRVGGRPNGTGRSGSSRSPRR